jgi:NADH:ubiquinone oxidoreductase subunit 5 (subunit L)/multisubunit Na+/H+ antiporter MnhA subunit
VDQTTIIAYAAGYVAAIFGAFLLYLPLLIGIGLLLLLAGTVTLVVLFLKAVTVGLYGLVAGLSRTPTGGVHRAADGDGLVPH